MEHTFPPLVFLLPGLGALLVALFAVLYWRKRWRMSWSWFWVGAAIWVVGVSLKILGQTLLHERILGALSSAFSPSTFLMAGGLYIGVHSAVFEIGVTLAAVLIWRKMARDAERALTVGLGAGIFEAFLLGMAGFLGMLFAVLETPGTKPMLTLARQTAGATPLFWLVAPVERVMTILCHTSTRMLVLFSVVKRRWSFFFWGFLLFACLDSIAGLAHLSGKFGRFSIWWVELAVAPFALVSLPIIRWCLAHWPARGGNSEKT
jgi:uncharacterized membrane protein YhfC